MEQVGLFSKFAYNCVSKGPDLPLPEGEYTGDCDSGGHVAAVFQSTQTLKSIDASC